MKIPYREHRFSPDDYEFVLATRKFYPQVISVVVTALVLGVLIFVAALQVGHSLLASAAIGGGVCLISLPAAPLLFLYFTGQLGAQNYILGNISSIIGHVNWPPIAQNVFAERPVTFHWSEIAGVVLRPSPWAYALDNLVLELNLRDGHQRILRVPRLSHQESDAFFEILRLIALRRGFECQWGHPLHPPLMRFPMP